MVYEIDIAGMKRNLKLFKVADDLQIAAFILFGDVEICRHCAEKLLEKAPEFDIMLTAEAKSIPLVYEMSRQAGVNDYIVARKGIKVYMEDIIEVEVHSITTQSSQTLYLGNDEVQRLKGKRVLIVDDVISTGESLSSLMALAEKAGGTIAGKMAVLAEGKAFDRKDISVLAKLPLFDGKGNIL